MSSQFMSEEDNIKSFVAQMSKQDRAEYEEFQHHRIDPGYVGRIYILYKENPQGQPDVLGQIKITAWESFSRSGSYMDIEDMATGQTKEVTHVPTRIFDYDAFIALPPYSRLRYDARVIGGVVQRSTMFSVVLRTKVRSSLHEPHVTFCESVKNFNELFPDNNINLAFI